MNRLKVLQETVSSGEEAAFVILSRLSGSKGRDVKLPRISIVQYLNTAPLVRGFTHGSLCGKYELSFTVPSQCAEALRTGAVDIAIIPAIEYQRTNGLVMLPGLCIASRKTVRSLLLVSKVPLARVKRIALDRSSRSTQALTRILCQKHWGIAPEFFEAEPDLSAMLARADAALLIGDPALRLALGDAAELEKIGSKLQVYDIVEQWRAMTNLPAVLAIWAGRPEAITEEVTEDFQASLAFGMQHLDEISAEAAQDMKLPALELKRYLADNIHFRLDGENLRGLRRYFDLAAELGLIDGAKEIVMAGEQLASEAHAELSASRHR
jgi:chorismate dehydratase